MIASTQIVPTDLDIVMSTCSVLAAAISSSHGQRIYCGQQLGYGARTILYSINTLLTALTVAEANIS